jgi:AraC-like DNA-binding protein
MQDKKIPLLDCPVDFLIGDATGKLMNEYGRFPCKIQCGVYAMMVRGSATATINITRSEFRQNDVLFLEPGSFLLIHEFSEDALVYYLLFSSSFWDKNTFGYRMPIGAPQLHNPVIRIDEEKAAVFRGMAELLMQASNTRPAMLSSENMVYVFNLLQTAYANYVRSTDEAMERPQDRPTEICHEYTRLVIQHYAEWHQVSMYADEMHISLPHLCSTVKQVCQRTAGEIINDAILTDAKAQLKITNLQIKEIALSLGFENVAFFNRFFKSHTGITPKMYRNA